MAISQKRLEIQIHVYSVLDYVPLYGTMVHVLEYYHGTRVPDQWYGTIGTYVRTVHVYVQHYLKNDLKHKQVQRGH